MQGPELKDRLNRSALLEFLLHGVWYTFPAQRGTMTRGVPRRYAASPLERYLEQGKEPLPVWPSAEGSVRGYSYAPLHKNVPKAAPTRCSKNLLLYTAFLLPRLRQMLQIGCSLRMVRRQAQGMQELRTGGRRIAIARFHHTQVVPSIGVVRT